MVDYLALGIMSGSSLDGLDVCLVRFESHPSDRWTYRVERCATLPLPEEMANKLQMADTLSGRALAALDVTYGQWIAEQVRLFLAEVEKPAVIGMHGHTVFHEPGQHFSIQIGSGAVVAEHTGIPVVDRFREKDVIMGGQGAPLVPNGERYLYPGFGGFVNLGGIANASVHSSALTAWDVAPCNQILNHFAQQLGFPYDDQGALASAGQLRTDLLQRWQQLDYFHQPPPKSLANQWSQEILQLANGKPEDLLCTYTHFLAHLLVAQLQSLLPKGAQVLFTGGGTFNNYLMERIREAAGTHFQVVIPDAQTIAFKEAIIFAFLGLRRKLNLINVFCEVTGARANSCSGILHEPTLRTGFD